MNSKHNSSLNMDIDDCFYSGEEVKLDKVRHVKYTIRGLKIISKKFGSVVKAFEKMQTLNQDMDTETLDNLVLLLHAGLIHEDKNLTVDDVENMLTMENLPVIFNKILVAFGGSTPQSKDDGGSEATEGEQPLISTDLNTRQE